MKFDINISKRHLFILGIFIAITMTGIVIAATGTIRHDYDQLDLGPLAITGSGVDVNGLVEADSLLVSGNAEVTGNLVVTGELDADIPVFAGATCGLELLGGGGKTTIEKMPCKGVDLNADTSDYTLDCPDGYVGMGMDFGEGGSNRYLFTCVKE